MKHILGLRKRKKDSIRKDATELPNPQPSPKPEWNENLGSPSKVYTLFLCLDTMPQIETEEPIFLASRDSNRVSSSFKSGKRCDKQSGPN